MQQIRRLGRGIGWTLAAALILLVDEPAAGAELEALEGCRFVATEWADGDSFLVQAADGARHTIRLYGADCIETRVADETDARRLRAQRRYFGITEVGGSAQASIDLAVGLGQAAADESARVLARPFTVHTAFADARGDGRFPRIYGFVTTADGEDLAFHLVKTGLARAFGVSRATPRGFSAESYRAGLQDLEVWAAKRGEGAWAHTDWEAIVAERQLEREETDELRAAVTMNQRPARPLDPNMASRDELMRLPGVGEVLANRVIEGRPYATIEDLTRVQGIGGKTFSKLREFLVIEP